jgi:hypothetical protein
MCGTDWKADLCQSFGDSEVVNVVYAILILIERLVKFWVLIEM